MAISSMDYIVGDVSVLRFFQRRTKTSYGTLGKPYTFRIEETSLMSDDFSTPFVQNVRKVIRDIGI